MRKWVLVIALMLLPSALWAAWVTETEWGYQITGTTNTVGVATDKTSLYVTEIVFYPANATDTATFTSAFVSGDTQRTCLKMNQYLQRVSWPGEARQFRNLEVTLSNASDIVCVYTKK